MNKFYNKIKLQKSQQHKIKLMNVVEIASRVRELQQQNERLRLTLATTRNGESHRNNQIDFETKYKKALKQIYEVIQANKQLKEELQKLKTSRNKMDGNMADVRKEEIYKVYEVVLNEKNELKERAQRLEGEQQRLMTQLQAYEAQVNILKGEKMYLAQQKQALESKTFQGTQRGSKTEQMQQLQQRLKQKQQQFHRTLQNYEQHHITLSNQSKKNEERVTEIQQKLMQNDKNWRNRFEAKEIEFKEIRTSVRHEYQDQINSLRKEVNSLKLLNTELMTKLQTIEMQGRTSDQMTDYELQMLNSIKQLRLQMQPLRRQIIQLQELNSFEKQQAERQHTQLQLKLYEYESNIQHYSIQIKNQEEKILKLNEAIKKHSDNQSIVKRLEEENRILGGRVIVLESRELATDNRREGGARKLEENILEFQTRVEMLLNQKQNLANLKNISIHQLVSLKAYIAQLDQKLKSAYNQNDYATKKYKSYKQKYLSTVKQIKNHEVLQNTLKSKILGYDKLVQRLQSQLQKNVNINQMQVIDIQSRTSHELVQIQNFKKKYQSLKEKLLLQEKYNRQELQTVKLNYETKIVDLNIKVEEINTLRQSINLYKQKNEQLTNQLAQKENQILEVRLSINKQVTLKNQNDHTFHSQNRQIISSLQQTIHRLESQIIKLQTQIRSQQDSSRKRILTLERELQDINSQYNKLKLATTAKATIQKTSEELGTQNKRLKNKIAELESQIILIRGRTNDETSKNSYELQFRISTLEIEKNQFINKLETQTAYKKRIQKQYHEAITKINQLDTQLTQLNIQHTRKLQQLKHELTQKILIIQTLEQETKRLKTQQRTSLETSNLYTSSIVQKEDHSTCQNKIKRLQRQLQNTQKDNQLLRKKVNEGNYSSNSFNFQLETIKHERQEARLKTERLQKELNSLKSTLHSIEDEKYELTRTITSLKAELSSIRLNHQDELFEKDRLLTQLKSKLQHNESLSQNWSLTQYQLEQTLQEKQRQLSALRSRLSAAESDMEKMNDTINKYNKEITSIKYANQSSHSAYNQQMEQLLEEKGKTLRKYQEQIRNLHSQIEVRNQEISLKTEAFSRVQRELDEFRQVEEEIDRLKSSLNDRETLLSKNRFEISSYEEENERAKKQISSLKEELQRVKFEILNKDDEISSLRLEISTLGNRVSNQMKNEFMEQLSQKESQLSRLTFQLQSLQNSYNNLHGQLSQLQGKERKAQQDLMFTKSQLMRTEEQLNETSEKLMKRQSQLSQMNGQMTGLKFLQEQVNEKNMTISKLRGELTSVRIQINHLTEQFEYKESAIIRQNNELKLLRQQVMEREEQASRNDMDLRNVMMEVQRLKTTMEDNQFTSQQKDMTINRLNTQLNKVKKQHRDLEEEIQERQQEWSNIQYELNQAKNQLILISDQIQGKDITITKLSNQSAFLKQEITRLNEQLVEKNQQINRISQQVFVQKMQYTNRTSEEVQTLSNQIFSLKRQLESLKHTIEDLEAENRRLKIQVEGSRIKLNQQNNLSIYTEDDMAQLKEDNNRKYRQIMQLQFELTQHSSENDIFRQRAQIVQNEINQKDQEIALLQQKTQKLQVLIKQLEEQDHYNNQNIQSQIQQFIETERRLRYQLEEQQRNMSPRDQQDSEELKFGLKLYTEETDRLKMVNEQLVEEVNALRLKLAEFHNQEDRIQQNLITMVLSFAQIESLRERVKNKEIQIKEVRKSFIQAISSGSDLPSQGFKSSKLVNLVNQNHDENIKTFEDVMSQNSASLINYKSEVGENTKQGQVVKEIHQYEVRSQDGNVEHMIDRGQYHQNGETHSLYGEKNHQEHQNNQKINLPEPRSREESIEPHETSHHLAELNQMRESDVDEQTLGTSQVAEVTFRNNQITPQESVTVVTQNQVTTIFTPQQQAITASQQRGRTVNITYQGTSSQVQTASSFNASEGQQRISSSQFQAPSGNTYVRITSGQQRISGPSNVIQSPPGIYIPQGMNIAPIRQPIPISQSIPQQGNRIMIPNNSSQHLVTGSFPQNPQHLRY